MDLQVIVKWRFAHSQAFPQLSAATVPPLAFSRLLRFSAVTARREFMGDVVGRKSHALKRRDDLVDNPHLWPDGDKAFLRGVLQHNNPKRALMESGLIADLPSGWSQKDFAAALMLLPHIAEAIEEARRSALHAITNENVLAEIAKIAFFNPLKLLVMQEDGSAYSDLSHLEASDGAAIRKITSEVYTDGTGEDARPVKRTTIEVEPKTPALQMLGRYLGMLDADNNVNVNVTLGDGSRIIEARRRARAALSHGQRVIEHRKTG